MGEAFKPTSGVGIKAPDPKAHVAKAVEKAKKVLGKKDPIAEAMKGKAAAKKAEKTKDLDEYGKMLHKIKDKFDAGDITLVTIEDRKTKKSYKKVEVVAISTRAERVTVKFQPDGEDKASKWDLDREEYEDSKGWKVIF